MSKFKPQQIKMPPKAEVEKEVKATVTMISIRPEPRLRMLLTCLNNQTYKNFEFVFVDALRDKRKKEVKELAKEFDIEMYHLKDKPANKPPGYSGSTSCSGVNTAIINSAGPIWINTDDNIYACMQRQSRSLSACANVDE